MRKSVTLAILAFLLLNISPAASAAWFPIYDGDRIVFLGDSITERRLYTAFLEAYTIGRFPNWKLQFRNAGWVSDTAEGGLKRLERDVLTFKPSVVTVAYGMNDGQVKAFDQAVCDGYIANQKKLAETLKAGGVNRVIFFGPGTVDPEMKASLAPYPDTLKKMSEALAKMCEENEYSFVDWWTPLDSGLKQCKIRTPGSSLMADGVHPNFTGHLLMAYAVLDAMDAPALVAEVSVTVPSLKTRALNAQVRELEQVGSGIRMKVEEKSLPLYIPEEAQPAMEMVPILTRLNREILIVGGLNPGSYDLKIDGKLITTTTDVELARGINLTMYNTPAWEQAAKLWELVLKKNDLYFERWRKCQLYEMPSWMDAAVVEPMKKAALEKFDKEIADLEAQITAVAAPVQRLFEVTPTPKAEPT